MSVEQTRRCRRCGHRFADGDVSWRIRVEAASEFDGHLPELDETDAALRRDWGEVERAIRRATGAEADDEVFEAWSVRVCATCRKAVRVLLAEFFGRELPETAERH